MSILKSSNPTLSEKMWNRADGNVQAIGTETMTVRGAINKFGFLLLLVIGAAVYTWNLHAQLADNTMNTLMMVGIFGGLIVAIAISFKPTWAPLLAPLYAILEGFFLGGISVLFNSMFAEKYPGLIMQAVGLTFGVAIAMFILYNFRIIKVTDKLRSVIISATMGILLFYVISMVLRLFHVNVGFTYDSSLLGIGISLFIVAIAALNLLLDFDMIERGASGGAPKFMEWYGAFGLLVTIVWLYIEILKLLSRFAGRK
ncbi:MAG: Bax inhibitor-1/YccA family protein [Chitinophagaceae bacterium]